MGAGPAVPHAGLRPDPPPARAARDGGRHDFHFVTEGIEGALERAVNVAGDRDINLAGGAHAIGQYLAAGLVDLLEVHVVPVLLGGGERLFDLPPGWQERYERDRLVASPAAAHFRYLRKA